ncbi:MAG: hypothetical protein KBC34_01095 [Phenylobacterium sp.]|nr:hypothetical protein [Phenylobacterium sp.]
MLSELKRLLPHAILAAAAIELAVSVSRYDFGRAFWAAVVIWLALEVIALRHRLKPASSDRCTQCGRRRIGGGVFVAGLGSICFECEERKFGSDLLEGADDVVH